MLNTQHLRQTLSAWYNYIYWTDLNWTAIQVNCFKCKFILEMDKFYKILGINNYFLPNKIINVAKYFEELDFK